MSKSYCPCISLNAAILFILLKIAGLGKYSVLKLSFSNLSEDTTPFLIDFLKK